MEKITSKDNLTYPFTKTLLGRVFDTHKHGFGEDTLLVCFKASGRLLE